MRERLAGAFVLAVLGVACVSWWIGVPALTLWGLSKATDDFATHFVGGLLGVPLLMATTAPILIWLNGLYLRVSGAVARADADEEETGWRRQLRGPLEPMLLVSFIVAAAALSIWFFFIAETAPRSVI
jgi:hypothetical protein